MSKRNIYIIAAIATLLVVITLLVFTVFKPGFDYQRTNAFKAIPDSSPMFMVISKPSQFLNKTGQNELAITLSEAQLPQSIASKTQQTYAYLKDNENVSRILRNNELVISLNYSGRDNIDPLFIITLNTKTDHDLVQRALKQIESNENIKIEHRKYNRVDISQFNFENNSIHIAVHEGLCLIAEKSLVIEEAIRQLNTGGIDENPELQTLLKTTGSQADINLFLNHKHADRLLSKYTASNLASKTSLVKTYAGWTEIDINLSNDKILMSGFTAANRNENYFSNTLQNQQPATSRIDRVLPQSTAFYTALTLSNFKAFFTEYEEYLNKRNLFFQRQEQLTKIERESSTNIQNLFLEIVDQEVAMAGIITDQNNPQSGRIFVVNTKSGSLSQQKMVEMQQNYISRRNLNPGDWSVNYDIDNQTSFTIYRFPYSNLATTLLGQTFSGVQTNWFAVYENTLVFGDSHRTVSRALLSNVLGETLTGNMEYNRFKSNLNSRSNITFYSNTAASIPIASALFNNALASHIQENEDLRKFKAFAWQVSATGEMLYNNACLLYNPEIKSKPQTIWQSNIGSAFDFKPKFVINHNDRQNREIVIQDNKHNFYLINNVGRIVWQIKLDGPIMGEVHQIDYFKNGKLQYLFNTESKIYLIDRNGNNVNNFPITLRAKASNGVSVFDYNNNRDYRLFVACTDRNIYAYNMDGNLLNGWNIFKTDHEVSTPIQHFRVDGKDFIVASDNMRDYILHRRGTIRVNTAAVYAHSANNTIYLEDRSANNEPRLVATDTEGNLHYIYLEDGKHEMRKFEKMSDTHFFLSENITSAPGNEYVFADKNQLIIFNSNGKEILRKKLESEITHRPNIYTFSGGVKKVGITCKNANKISLFDINGTMHPGFPLDGSTEFSIGFITSEMLNFNLLVGSPDGFLYNYYVE